MTDFLLEFLSEEIPARMQAGARNDLARLFAQYTEEAGLSTEAIDVHSTPRRLVLIAREVAEATQASREEIKGPRASAPPQALEGFLRKTGLTRDQLEDRDGVLFAVVELPGRAAADILADTVKRIVADFPWPKSMRWGPESASMNSLRWVRPLHGIVAMLGEKIVPLEIDGIASGATTVGHRFHHPGPITVGGASDYLQKLRACHVIVDQDERERIVREGAAETAREAGLALIEDEGLVVENAGLTEWPVPLLGRFDADFLDVPREVIVLTMRTNQKYFACTNDQGLLAPAFVCVANVAASDGGEAIAHGNARVLAARLADARFFWEQDLKIPLEEQAKKLSGIIFHEKLGTVADKIERVAKLARWLAEGGIVKGAKPDQVERAARLAKADLVSGMVGEFPELQGVIGGYLAEAQDEPKVVADAIRDHYKPVGQGNEVPTAPVSVALALADKLDTLVGFFAIDEQPSGSKDPYALRRSALGAMSIFVHNSLRFSLFEALLPHLGFLWKQRFQTTSNSQMEMVAKVLSIVCVKGENISPIDRDKLDSLVKGDPELNLGAVDALIDFLVDRLAIQQRESGVRHDLIKSVVALGGTDPVERLLTREYDLVRLLARVKALQAFVETGDGNNLLVAYKRAANILKKEKWEGTPASGGGDVAPQEKALIAALDKAEPKASAAIAKEDFTAAMSALSSLRKPIDDFFDHVTVNDPDAAKRERRLNLLMRFRDAVNRVADFSKIEG